MPKPWGTSTRRATLPANWRSTTRRILNRDRRICYVCLQPDADAVDHIVPHSQGGTDDDDNLAAIHDRRPPHCHRTKSSREGAQARAKIAARRRRPPEPHPGATQCESTSPRPSAATTPEPTSTTPPAPPTG